MVSFRLIDRIGRRKILLYTLVAMIAGLFFMGFSFIFIPTQPPPSEAEDGMPGPGEGEGEGGGRFRVGSANANAWAYISLLSMIWFCGAFALGLGNVVSRSGHVFRALPSCVVSSDLVPRCWEKALDHTK